MTVSTPSKPFGRPAHLVEGFVGGWNRVGGQARFYASTLAAIPDALTHYRTELLRLIAQMGLGSGALAVVGGTPVLILSALAHQSIRSPPNKKPEDETHNAHAAEGGA